MRSRPYVIRSSTEIRRRGAGKRPLRKLSHVTVRSLVSGFFTCKNGSGSFDSSGAHEAVSFSTLALLEGSRLVSSKFARPGPVLWKLCRYCDQTWVHSVPAPGSLFFFLDNTYKIVAIFMQEEKNLLKSVKIVKRKRKKSTQKEKNDERLAGQCRW